MTEQYRKDATLFAQFVVLAEVCVVTEIVDDEDQTA